MSRLIYLCFLLASLAGATELVRNGEPRARLVIASYALPQVRLAAQELRDHVAAMTGAELPIGPSPVAGTTSIFVGESEHTRALGLSTEGLPMEGYRIVATEDYLALLGRDASFERYPRGYVDFRERDALRAEWQAYAGEKWDFPWSDFYDPRNTNEELGFSIYDPTGTLFAVYDLLEQLGVRWYMPYHDFGTIIPEQQDLQVPIQERTASPVFSRRYIRTCFASDTEGFLWLKRQKLGMSQMMWGGHGTDNVIQYTMDEHPEYIASIGGVVQKTRGKRKDRALPRLAPPLRDAMVDYVDTFFSRYPEMQYASVGPSDAFTSIDDRDVAAGWLREERGRTGRISDYVWTWIDSVARGVQARHPERTVLGLAYSFYRQPPQDIERFSDNLGVIYCQNRSLATSPEARAALAAERAAWREMMPSDEFFVWEYYLHHRRDSQLRGVPILFTQIMQEDTQALVGVSKGEYVEAWAHGNDLWGINHLTYYVQARLYWEPDLDLEALLSEYYQAFYGPAAGEARAFFQLAEEVWMRPESRTITRAGGFLRPADVEQFFTILDRGIAKAGDTVYGDRLKLIREECQPMRQIFPSLQRQGPEIDVPAVSGKVTIDGDLTEAVWQGEAGRYPMRDLHSGEVVSPSGSVVLRWDRERDGLLVGIVCQEPQMHLLEPQIDERDSFSIFDNDVAEIYLEPTGLATFRAAININGAIYDAATDPGVTPTGTAWNPDWSFAVKTLDDSWQIELFVPRASLADAPGPTDAAPWGINVARTRFLSGEPENSAIAPTAGRFFTPSRFGILTIQESTP